jgi:nucleoside-diphosphate-sugar epimerase
MHTILGAGGVIGNELYKVLKENNQPVRLVSRNPKMRDAAETVAADLMHYQQVAEAVKGSSVVYLTAGLQYNVKIWAQSWPVIMRNTIDACQQHQAKLIFFDNIYCLGKVNGPMTEETPFNPVSKKGEIRARIASDLLNEIKAGKLTALIARAADFYGPHCKTSVFNMLVTDNYAKGKKAQWLINENLKHSFTYTPDCGKALWQLANAEKAWNQVWHLPTAHPPLTGKGLIEMAARYMGVEPRYSIISKWMIRLGGLFNGVIKELYEMAYQNDSDYIFDSSKIERALDLKPTPYEQGLKAVADTYVIAN